MDVNGIAIDNQAHSPIGAVHGEMRFILLLLIVAHVYWERRFYNLLKQSDSQK